MRSNNDDLPELDPDDVEGVIKYAVGDLLDIAAGVGTTRHQTEC